MSGTIINLILQLIAGAIGGNAAGALLKNIDLSPLIKTITGAVGGGIGGTILQNLIPALSAAASGGGFDIGAGGWPIGRRRRHRRDRHGGRRPHQKRFGQKILTNLSVFQ